MRRSGSCSGRGRRRATRSASRRPGRTSTRLARLYAAINQEGGGQDSKMTRNEAAALATIARMGWVSFTVRMLQQAIGLSYHQVRRILQGYTARGTVYCGLLEKCPALAVVDVTVIDESTGTTVRRHESHFQFDAERYREWVAELAVWLEDEGEGRRTPLRLLAGVATRRMRVAKMVAKRSRRMKTSREARMEGTGVIRQR